MKVSVVALVFLLVHLRTSGQNFCDLVSRQEVIALINSKVQSDNASKRYVSIKRVNRNLINWDSLDYDLIVKNKSLDSMLTNQDAQYIFQQFQCYSEKKGLRLLKNELKKVSIVEPKQTSNITSKDAYWEYSVPLFSKDHSLCIIKYAYVCGDMCMSFSVVVLKRTANGWIEFFELMHRES